MEVIQSDPLSQALRPAPPCGNYMNDKYSMTVLHTFTPGNIMFFGFYTMPRVVVVCP